MSIAHLRRTIIIVIACFLFIGVFLSFAQADPDPVNNNPPVNSLPGSVNTEPNTPVAIAASVSDPDVGGGLMEIELTVSGVGGAVTCGGTFSWGAGSNVTNDTLLDTLANANAALSTLTFTPQAGCTGLARMVMESDDQGNSGACTDPNPLNCILADTNFVNINIAAPGDSDPVNNPPVNFLPGSMDTLVSSPIAIPASVTDLDVGGGNMEVELTVSGVGGAVTCSGSFTWGGGTNVQNDSLTASLASVNAALSTLVFTPQAGCTGLARMVMESDDQGNSGTCTDPNPLNCILADTNFININILVSLPTATHTATAAVTNTPPPTNTTDPLATPVVSTIAPTVTALFTLTPVAERCLHVIPNGAVQGRMLYDVRAFFAPNLQSETPEVVIPGNSTWWIVGAANGFYQLFITCPGNLVWVPASSMIPNYDEVWNGAPLPNAGG